jgi:hypothetical protein
MCLISRLIMLLLSMLMLSACDPNIHVCESYENPASDGCRPLDAKSAWHENTLKDSHNPNTLRDRAILCGRKEVCGP